MASALATSWISCSPEREQAQRSKSVPAASSELGAGSEDRSRAWPWRDQSIAWRKWDSSSFREARHENRPVLIYLAAPGCEGVFSEENTAIRSLLEEWYVAIRVDPFKRPDLARRYGAGGWPSVATLLPDGRLFSRARDLPPANAQQYLWRLLGNFQDRFEVIEAKVNQAARRARRKPVAEMNIGAVYQAIEASFDAKHGGFGRLTKFPETAVLRFLVAYYEATLESGALRMVEQSIERLLRPPMRQPGTGVFAFSRTPDWQTPVLEIDALDQAGILLVLAQTTSHWGAKYKEASEQLIAYVRANLFRPDTGAFQGRQLGLDDSPKAFWTDPTIYADRQAMVVAACLAVGESFANEEATQMARASGRYLADQCIRADGSVQRTCGDAGQSNNLVGLLSDQVVVSGALLDLFEAFGEERYRELALKSLSRVEEENFDPASQAFVDRPASIEIEGIAVPAYVPYEDDMLPAGNPLVAGLYLRLGNSLKAETLLEGKRLSQRPGRSYSTYARELLNFRLFTGSPL